MCYVNPMREDDFICAQVTGIVGQMLGGQGGMG